MYWSKFKNKPHLLRNPFQFIKRYKIISTWDKICFDKFSKSQNNSLTILFMKTSMTLGFWTYKFCSSLELGKFNIKKCRKNNLPFKKLCQLINFNLSNQSLFTKTKIIFQKWFTTTLTLSVVLISRSKSTSSVHQILSFWHRMEISNQWVKIKKIGFRRQCNSLHVKKPMNLDFFSKFPNSWLKESLQKID